MLNKQKRYKPLYKKFLKLKEDIQSKKKFLHQKLKKKKWEKFNFFYNNLKNRRKKNFRLYDQTSNTINKYGNLLKKKYKIKLETKQKFSLFYGYLSNKYVKKTIKNNKKLKKNIYNLIVNVLELRLDVILYRSHFVSSVKEARDFINKGHVFVNEKIIKNNSYLIKKGDFIKVSDSMSYNVSKNTSSSNFWPLIPKYLQINYKTFQIFVLDTKNFRLVFPFFFNVSVLKLYFR